MSDVYDAFREAAQRGESPVLYLSPTGAGDQSGRDMENAASFDAAGMRRALEPADREPDA